MCLFYMNFLNNSFHQFSLLFQMFEHFNNRLKATKRATELELNYGNPKKLKTNATSTLNFYQFKFIH
jgi:hypothetical protein